MTDTDSIGQNPSSSEHYLVLSKIILIVKRRNINKRTWWR